MYLSLIWDNVQKVCFTFLNSSLPKNYCCISLTKSQPMMDQQIWNKHLLKPSSPRSYSDLDSSKPLYPLKIRHHHQLFIHLIYINSQKVTVYRSHFWIFLKQLWEILYTFLLYLVLTLLPLWSLSLNKEFLSFLSLVTTAKNLVVL